MEPGARNVLAAWRACKAVGLDLVCGDEPLDVPRDRFLAEQVVVNRASVRATDGAGLDVDLTLVMAGFDFETVWKERHTFRIDEIDIPVARLMHIVESKRRAGREKDRLFLAAHAEALREMQASMAKEARRTPTRKRKGRASSARKRPPR